MNVAYYIDADGKQHHQGTLIDIFQWKPGSPLPEGIEIVYMGTAPEVNTEWMAYKSSLTADDVPMDVQDWIAEHGPLQEWVGNGHALQEVEGYGEVLVTQYLVQDVDQDHRIAKELEAAEIKASRDTEFEEGE